jgi:polyisoprenoid-binding protein YceI
MIMAHAFGRFVVLTTILSGQGAALPAAAATGYTLDASKSTLGFTGTQSGGAFDTTFKSFKATVVFSPDDLAGSSFDVVVDMKSMSSGDSDRDEGMQAPEIFDVAKYPTSHFVAKSFTRKGEGQYEASGKLTIRDVTRDVRLPFTFKTQPEGGKTVATLKGEMPIKRLDYGVGKGEWADTTDIANEATVKYSLRLTGVAEGKSVAPAAKPATGTATATKPAVVQPAPGSTSTAKPTTAAATTKVAAKEPCPKSGEPGAH